ncbi:MULTISPECIES: endo alpha-1,4 polygalactosaminidase [unclassified Sphingomonas]|uniref:endo alpha-1,4 polygalactosaminidase n=1 Tax=unclassified Sphingomonas TaxID=196159 RepID=UPI001F42293A|nr:MULTISPECIES: endo alpha-1,4 polygalactosaminidase [unclassified Sphingomonas]
MIGRRQAMALGAGAVGLTLGLRGVTSGQVRPAGGDASLRWAVDYGPATDPVLARRYQLLVLEPHHPRPIAPLRGEGAVLLGYVSLGEVEKRRPYFAALDRAGALGIANPDWPDARRADLRHPAWTATVVDQIVAQILQRGYDGIFIDTMDNAEAMERQDPLGAKDMVAAGARLIVAIRTRFPAIRIMLNRGYALLDRVAPSIDYVLGESMASRWNFATKRYDMLSDSDWQWQADRLRAAKAINPALVVTTLDYWDMADRGPVAKLYARERAAGFAPYVSTLALDRLWPEPTG